MPYLSFLFQARLFKGFAALGIIRAVCVAGIEFVHIFATHTQIFLPWAG
jgi:hypothetical protein